VILRLLLQQLLLLLSGEESLFFGNAVKLSADVTGNTPIVSFLTFCNVVGIDSSAAQSIVKLKSFIQKNFNVKILLLVTGTTDGLRCNYGLSQKFVDELGRKSIHVVTKNSTPCT
jgi:SulP family sulfate permease